MEALISMLVLASTLWVSFGAFDVRPRAEVLRALAETGATLLVAYGLVANSIISAARVEPRDKRKERLGALTGIGASGLIGIAAALVLSERVWVIDPSWLEELAFGWTTASFLMFLAMIVFQADAMESWEKAAPNARRSRWLTRNRRRSN